jgi:alpha-N-arabinofuranosidase
MRLRLTCSVLAVIACSYLQNSAFGQANLPVYTDNYVNGFQDWGWGTRTGSTNAAVGTNSLSLSGTAWNVAFSGHHSSFNSSPYSNLTFRAHGGTTGGQVLRLFARVNGADKPFIDLAALTANTWKQFSIPLANLSAANQTNVEQFTLQLTSNGGAGDFYLDDIFLTAKPAPALTHISLNATQAVRSVDWRWFGINTAIWDSNYDTSQTTALLKEMGTRLLRGPGGSLSDEYHWSTDKSLNNTWTWVTSFANFVHVATNAGAQAIITVNYGSSLGNTRGGQAQEAAAWVAYANGDPSLYGTANDVNIGTDEEGTNWRTVGFWARLRSQTPASNTNNQYDFLAIGRSAPLGIKYWEIGNENYGTWERDFNTNAPYHSNEGWTYATRASNFFYFMRSVDPTIKIGVPLVPGEDSYNNGYTFHSAYNPRTATNHFAGRLPSSRI